MTAARVAPTLSLSLSHTHTHTHTHDAADLGLAAEHAGMSREYALRRRRRIETSRGSRRAVSGPGAYCRGVRMCAGSPPRGGATGVDRAWALLGRQARELPSGRREATPDLGGGGEVDDGVVRLQLLQLHDGQLPLWQVRPHLHTHTPHPRPFPLRALFRDQMSLAVHSAAVRPAPSPAK